MDSSCFRSYLRGREAIATLFPEKDENGTSIVRQGDITMFGGSGVRKLFGGDVQTFTPGGQFLIGVEGQVPPASAGLITQGDGNIQLYSKGSILLGLSRILTTKGGDILAWSRKAISTPAAAARRRSSTLHRSASTTITATSHYRRRRPHRARALPRSIRLPKPKTADVDLIAPLGTIDAGEAGIRSSANVNLAALQIVNAANIQAQGTTTGVPVVQAPNIGGLTEASNTAGAAAKQATNPAPSSNNAPASIIIVEVLGFGGGSGESSDSDDDAPRRAQRQSYNPNSRLQVVGVGPLTEDQKQQLTETERRSLTDQ